MSPQQAGELLDRRQPRLVQVDTDGELEHLRPDPVMVVAKRRGLARLEALEVREQQLFLDAQVCRQLGLEARIRCSRDIPVAGPESSDELLEKRIQVFVIQDQTRVDRPRR